MTQPARRKAPDLFEALRLEPLALSPGVPAPVPMDESDLDTAPRETAAAEGAEVVEAPFTGIADLLEPDEPVAEPPAPAPRAEPPAPAPRATKAPSGPVEESVDTAPATKAAPWPWIALTAILAGTLGWVLWTQTDLFSGDLVEKRRQAVAVQATREAERARAEAAAKARRYGQIKIDATPKGTRVFLLQDGPKAVFEGLPEDGAYVVIATAPGHAPKARRLSGVELSAPAVFQLEPAEGAPVPVPDPGPLEPGRSDRTVDLEVVVHPPGGRAGLLIGYAPGAGMTDVDTSVSHRFLLVAEGYEPRELLVKPEDFQAIDGQRFFTTHVELEPAAVLDLGAATGAGMAGTGAAPAGTGGAVEPEADAAPAVEAKKERTRRKKRRRRKKR